MTRTERESTGVLDGDLVLESDLILARTELSPQDLANASRAGRMDFQSGEGGRAYLEVGGLTLAEGRIVKKGGRHYFRVTRLGAGEGEV